MAFLQFMIPVAGLERAGIPERKAYVRHQPGTHASPAAQTDIGPHSGNAGNPLELPHAAVMMDCPGTGHDGNERPPRQPFSHLLGVGKARAFKLKAPVVARLPLELKHGEEGSFPSWG